MKISFRVLTVSILLSVFSFKGECVIQTTSDKQKALVEQINQYYQYNKKLNDYIVYIESNFRFSRKTMDFLNRENIELFLENVDNYPSVVIAMAILESNWGRSPIGNNYFGIKGKGHIKSTKEWNGNKYVRVKANFQSYKSKTENIKAVSKLLNKKRYNISLAKNYIEATNRVKNGGYATCPLYAYKIQDIIEKYELYKLDNIKI